ncbi:MAG: alanine dehydrogenase [Bacteroidales bacterium]|nr:MAG: alanine dehydrogenase [Bacteroidales bacterium]
MGRVSKPTPQFPFSKGLMPQEEMLEMGKKNKRITIGIPKEADTSECRIPLTPEAVEMLVEEGHEIIIEKGAGNLANYSDSNYSERGGQIVETPQEVFKSEIILKVAPLQLNETEYLKESQVIITSLHLNSSAGQYLRNLMQKRITAIAFESILDQDGAYPLVRAMSSIAGNTSILVAAEYLSNVNKGKGVMLGGVTGITPTEVVILGAGTAAEFAARAALGLGATVKVFDDSIKRLTDLQNILGQRLYTSIFHSKVLEKVLKTADVVIGTLTPEEIKGGFIVSEELVKLMKKGSVIIDLSIDKGGCFETSEMRDNSNPAFIKHDVIHFCIPNITSRVARTASIAMSNVFSPIITEIGEAGGMKSLLKDDPGIRHGVYIFNGILTNDYLGRLYNIPSRDINLLMAAF